VPQGFKQLPLAAEDHASAPPTPDPLTQARLLQKSLQEEIAVLDQQLMQTMDDANRGQLLSNHLEYLIKADSLAGHLEDAERQRPDAAGTEEETRS